MLRLITVEYGFLKGQIRWNRELGMRKSLSRANSLCLDKSAEGASADVYKADVLLTTAPLLVK